MTKPNQDTKPQPQLQVGPTPSEKIYAAQAKFATGFVKRYSGVSTMNPDGKNFRDWNALDFVRLLDGELSTIRAIFIEEHYDLIEQIKPDSMTRAEFSRSILREAARRGTVMDYYERRMPFPADTVTVTRPQTIPGETPPRFQTTITEDPAFITARDTAVGILRNPKLDTLEVQPDVLKQSGLRPLPEKFSGFDIPTDTATYDLGYAMGAAKQNRANGILPLSLIFDRSDEEITYGYCVVTNDMYAQKGRSIDQEQAFSSGFLQGRQDTSTNFDPADVRIGVLGSVCPPKTPPVNDNARLMLALRGSNDGRASN